MAKKGVSIRKKTLGFGIFLALFFEYILVQIPGFSSLKWVSLVLYVLIGGYLLFF